MDDEDLIRLARKRYANDNVQIELDSDVSRTRSGAWVQAWVWVDYPEESDGAGEET